MIDVVAGVLRDAAGRVLLAQRPRRGPHAGLWECPGGKREAGESAADALSRELHEELGIDAVPGPVLWRVPWTYPHVAVVLEAIEVPAWRGTPHGREGQALVWVAPGDLHRWPMPAADLPIAAALRLPRACAITPDPGTDAARLLADAGALLAHGAPLLQLRAKALDAVALDRVLSALHPDAGMSDSLRWAPADGDRSAVDVAVLVNGAAGLALADAHRWIGVHLTAADLARTTVRPLQRPRWVSASCHDAAELARAAAIDCDFVLLGPVLPTASHPGAPVLGWEGLAALCRDCPLPVFALGGLGPDELEIARAHGAFGVAGIRAFQP
ncbi:MAG: Nudix family hydrolase [Pseudomonadota bacterium]